MEITNRIQKLIDDKESCDAGSREVLRDAMHEINDLRRRIGDASIMLADWDGYYNPEKQKGNIVELANLIEDAFTALQGRSWRSEENTEPKDPPSNNGYLQDLG
jgi:hypothetical protein